MNNLNGLESTYPERCIERLRKYVQDEEVLEIIKDMLEVAQLKGQRESQKPLIKPEAIC